MEASALQRAVTVAGVTRRDLVQAVHASLYDSMRQGLPLRQARENIRAILAGDAETPPAVLRKHRLDTIVRTNTQHAYQAGRYAQMRETVESRPFWRYSAVMDRRTRPAHSLLHGLVYPANHEFWDQYYPPNGINCRCTVQTLSERQVERKGHAVEDELPGPMETVNKRTGEVRTIIPAPDPGFGRNPGRDWLAGLSPSELDKVVEPLPLKIPPLCKDGKGLFAGDDVCRPPLRNLDERHIFTLAETDLLPKGLKSEKYVQAFLKEFGAKGINDSVLHRLPGVRLPLVVSKELFIDKRTGQWKVTKQGRERFLLPLARTIKSPFEVWQVPASIANKPMPVIRLLRLFSTGDSKRVGGFAVFNLGAGGWTAATTFTPKLGNERSMLEYLERQRQGVLLFREE